MTRFSVLTECINTLVSRARQAPVDSQRLWINGEKAGWISAEACLMLITQHESFKLHEQGLQLHLPSGSTEADLALEKIADVLRSRALVSDHHGELLSVCTERADAVNCLGAIDRGAVRCLGLTTTAVHLVAYTPDQQLWVAQRSLTKRTDPGLWDTLVGGLRVHNETLQQALLRESAEEAGLSAEQLTMCDLREAFQVQRPLAEGYQSEWLVVFDTVLPATVQPVNQDGEVADIRLVTRRQVLEAIQSGHFTLEAALALMISFAHRGWLREGDIALLDRLPRRQPQPPQPQAELQPQA